MWSFILERFYFYQMILWHSVNAKQYYFFLSGKQLRLYIFQISESDNSYSPYTCRLSVHGPYLLNSSRQRRRVS